MNLQSPPPGNPSVNLTVRPARDEDEPFLTALRNETDAERLLFDHMTLEKEEEQVILDEQLEGYRKHYEDADWDKMHCLIECNGEPAGTFINFQDKEEIRLADIVISTPFRGMGIGFTVLRAIQQECEQSKRPLRLHVEKMSPAVTFYQQLGFQLLEDRGTHFFIEWLPSSLQGKKIFIPGS